jgi:hypothetical protein
MTSLRAPHVVLATLVTLVECPIPIARLPGWERAYLACTGPKFRTRESRHINSFGQLKWDDVLAGRRSPEAIALGTRGVEWHHCVTDESSFEAPRSDGTYDAVFKMRLPADAGSSYT